MNKIKKLHFSALSDLIHLAENLNSEIINTGLNKNTEKTGGYLTIMEKETGVILITVLIGYVSEEKKDQFFKNSIEKATRVFTEKLDSSLQSRNPTQNKWAGAIAGEEYVYSFSGHYEDLDELISLYLCYKKERFVPANLVSEREVFSEEFRSLPVLISTLKKPTVHNVINQLSFFIEKAIAA